MIKINLYLFFLISNLAAEKNNCSAYKKKYFKKVVILTSKGGGGNTTLASVVKDALSSKKYQIDAVNSLTDIFGFDELRKIGIEGEDMYDKFLQFGLTGIINFATKINELYFVVRSKDLELRLLNYIKLNNYDLVISVMPFINDVVYKVCKEENIPFCVVSADFDNSVYFFQKTLKDYVKFKFVLFSDSKLSVDTVDSCISKDKVVYLGSPLKRKYFQKISKKEKLQTRKDLNIRDSKPVVTIIMGSAGSKNTIYYLKRLVQYSKPVHVVACIGKNEKIRDKLNKIKLPACVNLSVVGFTDRLPQIFSISDAIITKSGPSSILEAAQSGVPFIVDFLNTPLDWERINSKIVIQNNWGYVLSEPENLFTYLDNLLFDKTLKNKFKNSLSKLNIKGFYDKFPKFIGKILD